MRSFPRLRIDALTTDVFAFAMTLLVLELQLADLPLSGSAALIADLAGLWQNHCLNHRLLRARRAPAHRLTTQAGGAQRPADPDGAARV